MTREELLNCLVDRPCTACKFKKPEGCTKWTCVFEEETEDEPKKGLWKVHDILRHLYHCSECQLIAQTRFNFCPNCGADMRGKADETDN